MQIKFGIATPSQLWDMSLADKQAMLQQIDEAGYQHIFMADHVSFRNGSGTDGFVEVAALSQLHPSLGVMISIYLLPLRHPLPVARQLATMAKIAPGRMLFGIGVGGEDRHEIEVCGVNPATRGKRTNEALHIIRQLLDGESVSFDGEHFTIEEALIKPQPAQPIPIIVGGRSDAALRRAGSYGEGWIGVWCSPQRYAQALALVHETAEAAGREAVPWQHGYQPWIGVAETREEARQVVKKQMESFYKVPFDKFERYTPYGTPQDVATFLAEYAEAGCRLFNIKVCTAKPQDEVVMGAEVREALLKLTNA
ncbi:MAG: LLM class flavin-dependent oxidoreductase [Pseudomonadota bacterium]